MEIVSQNREFSGNLIFVLSELNSKSASKWELDKYAATTIPKNADINDYTEAGSYSSADSVVSATLQNSPYDTVGFMLYVIAGGSNIRQMAFSTVLNEFKMRVYSSNSWGDWELFQGKSS